MGDGIRGAKYAHGRRIAYRSAVADSGFWDERWANDVEASLRTNPRSGPIVGAVQRHLRTPARVLEGGCGLAEHSRAMHRAGYEVTALDFAPRTIDALRLRAPEVNPTLGDVRALPFPDGSFDGYLSPGVIEHFYEGWGEVGAEAYRVLRPSGFFFVTFPAMSRLRRILLARGHYPQWESRWRAEFYQFALDVDEVGGALSRLGFSVHRRSYVMGLSGLEDAFPVLEPAIAKARRARRPFRAVAGAIGRLLEPVAGHIAIVVARKP